MYPRNAARRRDGKARQVASAPAPATASGQARPARAGHVPIDPVGDLIRPEDYSGHVESRGIAHRRLGGCSQDTDPVGQCRVQPVPQHPELQRVEQLVDLLAVPRNGAQVVWPHLQRHVADQLRELAVAQDACQVIAQCVARLALDLVDAVNQVGQRAELGDPPCRGLFPDTRDARQVVAGVAAQGSEVGILRRGQPVLSPRRTLA